MSERLDEIKQDNLMTISDFKFGDVVIYVPGHALGDKNHRDCEQGMVSSVGNSVFVKFAKKLSLMKWKDVTAEACSVHSLVKCPEGWLKLSKEEHDWLEENPYPVKDKQGDSN